MLKKKNLFFTFIILCLIIFISLNNIFKNYNYSIILVKFDRNVDKFIIDDTLFNFFFDEIDKMGIDKKNHSMLFLIIFRNGILKIT